MLIFFIVYDSKDLMAAGHRTILTSGRLIINHPGY